jgi:RNA polymerase sigma-32 factor
MSIFSGQKNSNLPSLRKAQDQALPSQQSPLQSYLKEINRYPLLSAEEEYDLAVKHFESGDLESAQRLVTSNLRLVVKIANDFRRASPFTLDLIQEGNYGLMKAVKKFNPFKGVKLSSYAAWWIKAYILKFLMDSKGQVRVATTAAQRKLYYNLRRETEKQLKLFDDVDPKRLAEALDVKERDVVEMQKRLETKEVSMDAQISSEDGVRYENFQVTDNMPLADNLIANNQLMEIFEEQIEEFKKTLSGRDLDVFLDRMIAETPLTLQEIGDKYKISRERARQIEARILKSLKEFVQKDKGMKDLMDSDERIIDA